MSDFSFDAPALAPTSAPPAPPASVPEAASAPTPAAVTPVTFKVVDAPWYPNDPQDLESMLNGIGANGWGLQVAIPSMPREKTRWIFQNPPAGAGSGGSSPPAGSLVLLADVTASNSPSLQILNIPTGYKVYVLELINLVSTQDPTSSEGGDPHLQFSTTNGASWDTAANYTWQVISGVKGNNPGGNWDFNGLPYTSYIALNSSGTSYTPADGGYSGTVRMYNLMSTTMNKNVVFTGMAGGPQYTGAVATGGGAYKVPASAVNALQVIMGNTGGTATVDTIVSGEMKLYGVT